jgi:hypothetical protein
MFREKGLRALITLFFIILLGNSFSCGYQENDGISNSNKGTSLDSDMERRLSEMLFLDAKKTCIPSWRAF